jgi:hypothetical protein
MAKRIFGGADFAEWRRGWRRTRRAKRRRRGLANECGFMGRDV